MKRLTLTVTANVDAELVIKPAYGDLRPPSEGKLIQLGLISKEMLARRCREIIAALFGEEDEDNKMQTSLRYLIEYAGYYAGLPLASEAIEGIRPFLASPEKERDSSS